MADDMTFDFGIRLKDLRKKRGLSQKEAAAKLDVHINTIRHYEDNTVSPPIDKLFNLAVLYNSSVDYILGLTNRTNIFIDDMPINQQEFIVEMINQMRLKLGET